ncbi:glutathione S-transferase [Yoonia sp. 2307UL14-13]|uniref:glutathione S-transferase n=1 Tax=Yoonia sp. 2307UL14-13 TaxID=3126506 RepID=UPI00309D337E
MKLLISPPSPFVRKVRVLLREADLMDRVTEVEVSTTPLATDLVVMAANPVGKIPTLIRDEGPAIYDSRVICRYLDTLAETDFYPSSRLWEVLTLEATADGIMDAAVGMVYEARFRPEAQQSPEWLEAQWEKVDRAVSALNMRWMSHLAGPVHTGQIAVGCALSYLDFRHEGQDWRAGHDALAAWHAAFVARDSMVETRP